MGEIADMMLEGILCQQCGVYMEGDAGFPRTCASCRRQNRIEDHNEKLAPGGHCAVCGKKVRPNRSRLTQATLRPAA